MNVQITDAPIFVVGAPRSGTSMMQWSLRQHPELWGGPESDFLIPLIKRLREVHAFGSEREQHHWLSGLNVDAEEFIRHVGTGINAMYTERAGGLRWVEQTPQYTLALDDLASMFPGSLYVMMLRDGREVVTSLRHFVRPKEHEEACRLWVRFTTAQLEYHQAAADFIRDRRINSSFAGDGTKPTWRDWTVNERQMFMEVAGDLFTRLGFETDASWMDSA